MKLIKNIQKTLRDTYKRRSLSLTIEVHEEALEIWKFFYFLNISSLELIFKSVNYKNANLLSALEKLLGQVTYLSIQNEQKLFSKKFKKKTYLSLVLFGNDLYENNKNSLKKISFKNEKDTQFLIENEQLIIKSSTMKYENKIKIITTFIENSRVKEVHSNFYQPFDFYVICLFSYSHIVCLTAPSSKKLLSLLCELNIKKTVKFTPETSRYISDEDNATLLKPYFIKCPKKVKYLNIGIQNILLLLPLLCSRQVVCFGRWNFLSKLKFEYNNIDRTLSKFLFKNIEHMKFSIS